MNRPAKIGILNVRNDGKRMHGNSGSPTRSIQPKPSLSPTPSPRNHLSLLFQELDDSIQRVHELLVRSFLQITIIYDINKKKLFL